jgi:hypothetical protein
MTTRNLMWSILATIACFIIAASSPAAADIVSCTSYNGQRAACRADTRNGVAMTEQSSWKPCMKGTTWDVQDNNNIWVDQGCRANFTTGVAPRGYADEHERGHEHGQENARAQYVAQTITCGSYSNERTNCPLENRGDVRMTRQLSWVPCVQNTTWGFDSRGIWVDHGCRAEFSIGN